jgi:hypothetical protein
MPKSKRWVVVSSLALSVALSCAEAEDPNADTDPNDEAGSSGSGGAAMNTGGKSTAGTTSQGGKSGGAGGKAAAGGKGGSTGNHAGTATEGGRAGTAPVEEGGADTGGSGGSSGSGPMALGCIVEAAGGMPASEGGMSNAGGAGEIVAGAPSTTGGADSGNAGADSGTGGAPTGPLSLFSDDFESGQAAQWTPTGGTWAIVADGTQAYEQSLLENKLQISIANDTCFADQIIEARVKVTEFKGQSNSYVAALYGRALSPSTHYLLALGSDKKLILRKRINSTGTSATAISSAIAFTTTPDQWYDVRFEIIGTSLKGCVGAVCVTGTDSSIASGGVGVGTVNTSARFDDVRVTAP